MGAEAGGSLLSSEVFGSVGDGSLGFGVCSVLGVDIVDWAGLEVTISPVGVRVIPSGDVSKVSLISFPHHFDIALWASDHYVVKKLKPNVSFPFGECHFKCILGKRGCKHVASFKDAKVPCAAGRMLEQGTDDILTLALGKASGLLSFLDVLAVGGVIVGHLDSHHLLECVLTPTHVDIGRGRSCFRQLLGLLGALRHFLLALAGLANGSELLRGADEFRVIV